MENKDKLLLGAVTGLLTATMSPDLSIAKTADLNNPILLEQKAAKQNTGFFSSIFGGDAEEKTKGPSKHECNSKEGCPSTESRAAKGDKFKDTESSEKKSCSTKDGCSAKDTAKKEAPSKESCAAKSSCDAKAPAPEEAPKEKMSCGGKDGCPAKA